MLLRIIEVALCLLSVFAVATQIVVPMWQGRRLFPMFRQGRRHQLEAEIKRLKDENEEYKLAQEVQHLKSSNYRQLLDEIESLGETSSKQKQNEQEREQ